MRTDGGGWTLVWAYTFTDFSNYGSGSNAITPWPTFPNKRYAEVPISSTPPKGKGDFNATNFSLWKEIGKDFLITSNINHWISCRPGSGSLVGWTGGSIVCRNIKNVSSRCPGNCPTKIKVVSNHPHVLLYGSTFSQSEQSSDVFFYFEGYTGRYWPAHDPCSTDSKTPGVVNPVGTPYGNLYIR